MRLRGRPRRRDLLPQGLGGWRRGDVVDDDDDDSGGGRRLLAAAADDRALQWWGWTMVEVEDDVWAQRL
jgi:hypothetical protein